MGEEVLKITADFVKCWAKKYDEQYIYGPDAKEERIARQWLDQLGEPKFLDKENFVRIGRWKTKRQTKNYERNDPKLIEEVTRSAYQESSERRKLDVLMELRGVGAPVASTILYYFYPERFPIFDFHVRKSLKKAGLWERREGDSSPEAWEEYVKIMRDLSKRLGVSLRDLDKALWAYDKLGGGG